MIKCPDCNVELNWEDVIDTEWREPDVLANICEGSCPICKKTFQYTDIYKFSHAENIKRIKSFWDEED